MEAVFKARNIGWSKERIGSHVIRNNVIYDCGQNGIVGHLGCVFSEICGNEIYNIAAQGGAYVHNLCCGFTNHYPVLDRATPYHLPHSTEVLGTVPVYGFDDRWYQNIFVGGTEEKRSYGTALYNDAPVSLEEYIERFHALGHGDVEQFARVKQPAYINGNVYLNGADAFDREEDHYKSDANPDVKISEEGSDVYLEITLPREALEISTEMITTGTLGMVRIVEQRYENPDGSALSLNRDLPGETRAIQPKAGPVENLREGTNQIKVWTRIK